MSRNEPSDGLAEVLNAARAAVEQEFEISERLDSKARGLATTAGQWFAVVQAVSAIAYSANKADETLLYGVAGTAALGAVLLSVTFCFCWSVWKVRDEPAVSPGGLMQMKQSEPDLLVDHYATMLRDRRATNKQRVDALQVAQLVWFGAMALPLVQLGFALATRLGA